VSLEGTAFQKKVWKALQTIPWGGSISYGQLARRIGRPTAVRAVAGAVGDNPVPILVPCHRVVASDGSLGGYAYGRRKKAWLLRHERRPRG
jgi:O-6-methylguanine DNA methyltransferase